MARLIVAVAESHESKLFGATLNFVEVSDFDADVTKQFGTARQTFLRRNWSRQMAKFG